MPKVDRVFITPPTPVPSDIETKISSQLAAAGLRLERAPAGGDGYRIYCGNQILAGNNFGLTLSQIAEFIRRAGLAR